MSQFTSTTGKMAPETFLNFLQDLEKSTQHFWWYQLIVIALLIIGLTFFITYYYHWQRPTKSFWVKSWPINRFLLFVGLFLFCLLVLSQEQINTFFKDQIATNVAEKINQTLPASFTHANTNSAMLLPFSSKNFLTLNEYLQSTRLSLLQPFALIYCGGVAYSNLLLFFLQQKKTSGAI
ncbi:hypothetical protein [Enterococcus timonensis]|uniref:hypothetical protein n=1 Tax=Enterococcus timonensis TaxID=1852364 RepID=UPI001319EF8B|nr:hypothetical protein [Enterococcus timonensis]